MINTLKPKSLADWIKVYEQKTGDKHDIPNGFKLYYLPDRGYAVYSMFKKEQPDDAILVYEVCGDARFWHDMAVFLAQQNQVKNVITVCTRNIMAYVRFWGWDIKEKYDNEDGVLARMNGLNQYGKSLTIGIAFGREAKNLHEKYAYFCTTEVN